MVSILLKNNSTEVVVSLIENMEQLVKTVLPAALDEKILPAICSLASDKTWRIRLASVQFMPKLAGIVGAEVFQSKLESVLVGMLQDSVFAIREAVVDSMVKISEAPLDKAWLEEVFRALSFYQYAPQKGARDLISPIR